MSARWILPFNLPRGGHNHSNMRRWTSGRLVVDMEFRDENEWILASELSLAGRPLKVCCQDNVHAYRASVF